MDNNYYDHLLNFILFIKILTQDKVTDTEIIDSQLLIQKFVHDFENLYGSINLSFNLHTLLHLPIQVKLIAPLNKLSGFAFEGVFQVCGYEFHGTTNIPEQIANRLQIKNFLAKSLNNTENYNIKNPNLKCFLTALTTKKQFNLGLCFNNISINDASPIDRELLLNFYESN